jgi:hypothetical protein
MNTFWVIHKGVFVFRNWILNTDMAEELRDRAEKKNGEFLMFKDDRRTDFRNYYDFPTHEQFNELLATI